MQIWTFLYLFVFILDKYPENFVFLILRIMEELTHEVHIFLKKNTVYNVSYCFCLYVKKFSHISRAQSVKMRTLQYLANFGICICTPLIHIFIIAIIFIAPSDS